MLPLLCKASSGSREWPMHWERQWQWFMPEALLEKVYLTAHICRVDWFAGCWSRKDLKTMALICNGPAQTFTKKGGFQGPLARVPGPIAVLYVTPCALELAAFLSWGICCNVWHECGFVAMLCPHSSLLPQENIWFAFWWGNQGRYWCSQNPAGSQQSIQICLELFYTALPGPEWNHLQSNVNYSGTLC